MLVCILSNWRTAEMRTNTTGFQNENGTKRENLVLFIELQPIHFVAKHTDMLSRTTKKIIISNLQILPASYIWSNHNLAGSSRSKQILIIAISCLLSLSIKLHHLNNTKGRKWFPVDTGWTPRAFTGFMENLQILSYNCLYIYFWSSSSERCKI